MKYIILATLLAASSMGFAASNAPRSYSFQYKAPQIKAFQITRKATTREEAFRLAAQDCFAKLTAGKYPGEEKGLQIIDICANPKI